MSWDATDAEDGRQAWPAHGCVRVTAACSAATPVALVPPPFLPCAILFRR
jgi:hypothetical protein